ncbi:cytochrome c maturation protein CcmE [Deinococcus roseus]|uniref:Cytochrome c-type biogenesis protein CcmE n=1 Tax=Deinococcus roseus TaxID=392414 RepID=A0ABQ2CYV3_9DEIO|nr:cytochrome c maturation protein CcmE [Deinococcus roseus]GGJ34259.1 cytochrome c-type biogenesis protein CcmE [Deinococcus roseus]
MTTLPTARRRKQNPTKYLIGLVVLLGAIGYLVYGNIGNSLVYFVTPAEYQQKASEYAGKTLRMGGLVVSPDYNPDTLELKFTMMDSDGVTKIPVQYNGALPDLFKANQGVVVEGQMQNGTFVGKSLLVKHSEEYRAPHSGDSTDYKKLIEEAQ